MVGMILSRLSLEHFRNYTKQDIAFSPGITCIVGPNAIGKTNVLEAIYLLAIGRSFRAEETQDLVMLGNEMGRVKGIIGETSLELLLTTGTVETLKTPGKKYYVNGISRRLMDFAGNIRVVLFWPEDVDLITSSPSSRRKYLDSVLIQIDREYRRSLLSYERGLRQRNKILEQLQEGLSSRSQLLFWNQLLIKAGNYISEARQTYINYVNAHVLPGMDYHITYDSSAISEARLDQYKEEEVGAGTTLVGPHRDDMSFEKRSEKGTLLDVRKFGSRGEQRIGVLWLKLAELSYIEEHVGDRPLLLLDDIFSELDPAHRKIIFDLVGKQQTIITSADTIVIDQLESKGILFEILNLPLASV